MPATLAARLNEIHARVVSGSRTASRDLYVEALRPIKAYLSRHHSRLRDDDLHDLASDAIMDYLQEPARFDPTQASLWSYLCMTANADAIDQQRKRHRQHELLKRVGRDVELRAAGANEGDALEQSLDAEAIIRAHGHRLATNEIEERLLTLMLQGEKSTEAYAGALGLDPSAAGTASGVKQAKDRLLLRLRRLKYEL